GGKDGLYGLISLENPADEYSYMPDVVGRIGYSSAWGAVALTGAYDHERNGDLVARAFGTDGSAFAGSLAARFNIPSMPGSSFKIVGYYNSADSNYGPGSPLTGIKVGGAQVFGQPVWSVLASFLYQATPNLGLIVSGQYFGDHYLAGSKDTVKDLTGSKETAWAAELEAVWTPVKNFEVRPTIAYTKADHFDGTASGYLRFTRYF
ncbi:MAG: porin, partial [Rhizobiaceae bacterium]